ncbi:hypothetical protein LAZ67_12002838 [Cordylochernes scorpioides]|uniref:Uncharacterized protein n=1 Tax=Cordylochernes scorpioides TaxID=51811 RepID=A0ABY6L6Y6_9ARAC|nr:hypothetical protein LAZ67_12002838 [Cordylochernes scorpioides]
MSMIRPIFDSVQCRGCFDFITSYEKEYEIGRVYQTGVQADEVARADFHPPENVLFSDNDSDGREQQSDGTNFEAGSSSEPHLLTQGDLNDLICIRSDSRQNVIFSDDDSDRREQQSDDTNFEAGASSEPHLLTQGDLNDLVMKIVYEEGNRIDPLTGKKYLPASSQNERDIISEHLRDTPLPRLKDEELN